MAGTASSETANRRAKLREAVLDAATEEFLTRGYSAASLRRIINASGCPAGTLYRSFGSKEGLFRATVERRMTEGFRDADAAPGAHPTLEEELTHFAENYLPRFMARDALAFFRMMIAEAEVLPATSRRLWEAGPDAAIRHAQLAIERHTVSVTDARLAAAQFVDMIKSGLHLRLLLTGVAPSPEELQESIAQAVSIFCRGVRAG